jgi:LysR family transcriptional activator for leuABCD operon
MARNLRNIDLNLLTIFSALMHEKNLSYTANNLGMTQPAVSQALKRLRSVYNDPLFERRGGKMEPTLKAESIYPVIREILDNVAMTLPSTEAFNPMEATNDFHINVIGVDNNKLVSKIASELAILAPHTTLTVSSELLDDPEKSLRNREYDLHLDYVHIEATGCHSLLVNRDSLYIFASAKHPRLAGKKDILLSEYLAEKHAVLLPRKDNVYPLQRVQENLKLERNIKFTSSSVQSVLEVVGLTDYLCSMPGNALQFLENKKDYIWFNPPFKSNNVMAYMHWHWAMEHVQANRWLRTLVHNLCRNIEPLSENQ